MIPVVIVYFIDLFVLCFNFLLLMRIILSWFMQPGSNKFIIWLFELTEPILAPVRQLLPPSQVMDWAPLVTFFLLQAIQYGAHYALMRLASQ